MGRGKVPGMGRADVRWKKVFQVAGGPGSCLTLLDLVALRDTTFTER